jgi:hypothetical protein
MKGNLPNTQIIIPDYTIRADAGTITILRHGEGAFNDSVRLANGFFNLPPTAMED